MTRVTSPRKKRSKHDDLMVLQALVGSMLVGIGLAVLITLTINSRYGS